jgi:hypothetical protein
VWSIKGIDHLVPVYLFSACGISRSIFLTTSVQRGGLEWLYLPKFSNFLGSFQDCIQSNWGLNEHQCVFWGGSTVLMHGLMSNLLLSYCTSVMMNTCLGSAWEWISQYRHSALWDIHLFNLITVFELFLTLASHSGFIATTVTILCPFFFLVSYLLHLLPFFIAILVHLFGILLLVRDTNPY